MAFVRPKMDSIKKKIQAIRSLAQTSKAKKARSVRESANSIEKLIEKPRDEKDRLFEYMKNTFADDKNITNEFRRHAIVFEMAKHFEDTLKLDASGDVIDIMCAHAPEKASAETIADAIVAVWLDGMNVHLALAGAWAKEMKMAYFVDAALKSGA